MLDDRKLKVLYAIINSYVLTAEPVGSRTISKQYNLGVSSATIRNEMSDLEELGYLNKPHSSAGRVPSDKAYRLYVDSLLKAQNPILDQTRKNEIKNILSKDSFEIDKLIQNSAKVLSSITSYTALAITPHININKIKHIQLLLIGVGEILLVLVSNSGIVKNTIVKMDMAVTENQLNTISNFLNESLKTLSMEELIYLLNEESFDEYLGFKLIISKVVPIINSFMEEVDTISLYSDGITKILNFPEYKDIDKAKEFISFIENKDLVVDILLNNILSQDVDIIIGNENIYAPIKDCSIVTAAYSLNGKIIGKIGVIGPTRMEYQKIISTIKLFSANITEIVDMLIGE